MSDEIVKEKDLFHEWSSLNNVMSDWRSRFDGLREKFMLCNSREDAIDALVTEGYSARYPILPDWLK